MEDKTYIIKKSDMVQEGYVLIPISSLEEIKETPEHKDGDEVKY